MEALRQAGLTHNLYHLAVWEPIDGVDDLGRTVSYRLNVNCGGAMDSPMQQLKFIFAIITSVMNLLKSIRRGEMNYMRGEGDTPDVMYMDGSTIHEMPRLEDD